MNIKEVEARTGLTRANIRFYESKGLLRPKRGANNYREYTEKDVERLRQIALFRRMDCSIETIQQLFDGTLTVQEAAEQARENLQTQIQQLEGSLALCETMCERRESLDTLSVEEYERIMKELEQNGKWFRELVGDIIKENKRQFFCFWWFWEGMKLPRRYWFLGEFVLYEVLGMLYYHFCLGGDFCGISISPKMAVVAVIPIWFGFRSLLLFTGEMKDRDFPEDKDILHLVVEALYAVLWFCVIAVLVCSIIWTFFIEHNYEL